MAAQRITTQRTNHKRKPYFNFHCFIVFAFDLVTCFSYIYIYFDFTYIAFVRHIVFAFFAASLAPPNIQFVLFYAELVNMKGRVLTSIFFIYIISYTFFFRSTKIWAEITEKCSRLQKIASSNKLIECEERARKKPVVCMFRLLLLIFFYVCFYRWRFIFLFLFFSCFV